MQKSRADKRTELDLSKAPSTGSRLRRVGVLAPIFLIRCYQWMVRPLLIGSCKFCPTCSEYAIEALGVHGFLRGFYLSVSRVLRCHPFSAGGIDPVPGPFPSSRRD